MKAVLLSALLLCNTLGYAEETPKNVKFNDNKLLEIGAGVLEVGAMAGLVSLGSRDPKAMGRFMLALSPFMAGFAGDSPSSTWVAPIMAGGFFVGWGLYNMNKLDKGNYSQGEIFQRNMSIPLGAVTLSYGANWLFKKAKPDTKANINVTPLNDGAVLSLSSTF